MKHASLVHYLHRHPYLFSYSTIAATFFGPSGVKKKLTDICNETEKLVDLLATENNVDPYPHLLRFALNYMMFSCFGKQTTSINDPLFKSAKHQVSYAKDLTKIKHMASGYLPVLSFIDSLLGREETIEKHIAARDSWTSALMMEAYNDRKDCIATTLMDSVYAGEIDEMTAIVTVGECFFGYLNHVSNT